MDTTAVELLKKAKDVLDNYWFDHSDGMEYNNEDVQEVCHEIDEYLHLLKSSDYVYNFKMVTELEFPTTIKANVRAYVPETLHSQEEPAHIEDIELMIAGCRISDELNTKLLEGRMDMFETMIFEKRDERADGVRVTVMGKRIL